MFSSTILLVLACASAIAFNGIPPPNKCVQTEKGNFQNSFPVPLPPVILPPFTQNFKVDIPTVPQCVYGETGVVVKVCDTDVAPEAFLQDYNNLFVYRKGAAQFPGSVEVTVYCRRSP